MSVRDESPDSEPGGTAPLSSDKTFCLLLLPGMTLNRSIFPDFDVTTISIDFNTLELSPDGTPPPHPDGPMGHHADLLAQFLDGQTAWRNAEVRIAIGHSFGGMLLLTWMLAKLGQRTADGFMLVATTAGPMFKTARVLTRFGWRFPVAPFMPFWNLPMVTRLMKRRLSARNDETTPVQFQSLDDTSDTAVDRAGWRNTTWQAMRSFRCAMQGFDVRDRLSTLPTPATILHGNRDTLFSTQEGHHLSAGLPNARFTTIPGAGHALPLTHPSEMKRELALLFTRAQEERVG